MGYWNYRVVETSENIYQVCEVYYDDNDKPHSWGQDLSLFIFEDLSEFRAEHERIEKAFKKPVLKVVDGKLVDTSILNL